MAVPTARLSEKRTKQGGNFRNCSSITGGLSYVQYILFILNTSEIAQALLVVSSGYVSILEVGLKPFVK